jgi:hypothetical protein
MYLIIENLPAHTKAADVSALLAEKGFTDYEHIKIVGVNTVAAIVHCHLSHAELSAVAHYLDQIYWRRQVLSVSCTHIFSG